MKFISCNVNGLRACVGKGFLDFFKEADADIFCLQETKLQAGQIDLELPGYHQYWNYAEKKGYSGTAIFAKEEALRVTCGIGMEEHDHEGRVLTLEYPDFYFVTVYTPTSQNELARLDYRMKNPKSNRKNAGFTDEERGKFTALVEAGFIDTFRHFYPDLEGVYSWWSYRFSARAKNAGWRIDYFLTSASLKDRLEDAMIYSEVMGSDHCPVGLIIR